MVISIDSSIEQETRAKAAADEPSYPPALFERLLTVIGAINADLDHDVVLQRVCDACIDLVAADAAAFVTVDQPQVKVLAEAGFGPGMAALDIPISDQVRNLLAVRRERLILNNARLQLASEPAMAAALGPRDTVVVVPVSARVQFVGCLAVAFRDANHRLSRSQLALLDLLAGHGGTAVTNALAFEDAVRRQAHEKAVIDSVADGVATLDGYGMVSGWNRTAAELTGLEGALVAGRPLPFPVGTPEEPVEHRFPEDRWVEIVATPLEVGRVVVLRDISRQKALEAAKAMFVAATSHELKTPLTVIKSFADWLRDQGESVDSGRRQTAYEAIADSADELHHIVEKILLTAKTEAGRIDLSPQLLDPERLARGIAAPFDLPNHHLDIEVQDDLPLIWADQQAVRTAMGQLLENAVKYSPDGGCIVVSVSLAPAEPAEPQPDESDGAPVERFVRLAVKDQGIGLAPGEEDYLFMPFYQGETRSRSGVRGGVGLGLSIVRRLIEAQGGRVGAMGSPGQGSEFWITLPVASDEHHDLTYPSSD
ncbi:MAG: ATP-binding protein [Acidimicrobiales bacterium]